MLEGDHLLSHWLNIGRTLTQPNHRLIFRTAATNSANSKDGDPIDTSPARADTSWTRTAELTTNMKIVVREKFKPVLQCDLLSFRPTEIILTHWRKLNTQLRFAFLTLSFMCHNNLIYVNLKFNRPCCNIGCFFRASSFHIKNNVPVVFLHNSCKLSLNQKIPGNLQKHMLTSHISFGVRLCWPVAVLIWFFLLFVN